MKLYLNPEPFHGRVATILAAARHEFFGIDVELIAEPPLRVLDDDERLIAERFDSWLRRMQKC